MLKLNNKPNLFCLILIFILCSNYACTNQNPEALAQINKPYVDKANKENTETNSIKKDKVKPPEIISRQEWNAKNGIGKAKEHEIKFITIHHSATNQKPKISIERKLRNLQNFSQSNSKLANGKRKKAWFDIPYHYYISSNGKIGEAREIKYVGDTNTNYDPTGHALIVLEGNFEKEKPTSQQIESLQKLTNWLAVKYNVPSQKIKAHNDYTSTLCPGKNLKKLIPEIIISLRNKGES